MNLPYFVLVNTKLEEENKVSSFSFSGSRFLQSDYFIFTLVTIIIIAGLTTLHES